MKPLTEQQSRELIERHTRVVVAESFVRQPLVSAALIAFRHRPYLEAALEGVLSQQTNFPFEIIVGDDGSTDGSVELLLDYQQRFPDKIKLLLADQNLGVYTKSARLNIIRTLEACRGKYIAWLECDDYWTDPAKLQTQIDVLESDNGISMCHHRAEIVDERTNTSHLSHYPFSKHRLTFRKFLRRTSNALITGSIVYRKAALPHFPDVFLRLQLADWPMAMLLLHAGDGVFIDRVMGTYRQHAGGHWSSKKLMWHNWQLLRMAKAAQKYFHPDCQAEFDFLVWSRWYFLGQSLAATNPWRARVISRSFWRRRPLWALIRRCKQQFDRYVRCRGDSEPQA